MIRISNNEYIKVNGNRHVYRISDFFAIKKSTGEICAFYKKLGRAPMLGRAYQYLIIYPSGVVQDVVISEITKFDTILPSMAYDVYKLNPEEKPRIHVML